MRVLLLALIAILNTVALIAQQDISGQWNGLLKAPGAQLRVIFNVTKRTMAIPLLWTARIRAPRASR